MFKLLTGLLHKRHDAVISFPKSGRTWLRVMLDDLGIAMRYHHAGANHTFGLDLHELDTSAAKKFRRIVFMHRDPRDTAISGYFQVDRRRGGYAGTLSDFIRDPRHGVEKIFHYNTMWMNLARSRDDILTVAYEDLHADAIQSLARITEFLGRRVPGDRISAVVANNTFDLMHQRERDGTYAERYGDKLAPTDVGDINSFKVRRGKVGGYRDHLSAADMEFCDLVMARSLEAKPDSDAGQVSLRP